MRIKKVIKSLHHVEFFLYKSCFYRHFEYDKIHYYSHGIYRSVFNRFSPPFDTVHYTVLLIIISFMMNVSNASTQTHVRI